MITDKEWEANLKRLNDLAMQNEVGIKPLYEKD